MKKERLPSRRRHLSKEDEALWEHTAASLKPLKIRKSRHLEATADLDKVSPFEVKGKASASSRTQPTARPAAQASEKPPLPAPPPVLGAFDRKAARRLRHGRLEIEARIDLHGMRQHEAHMALRRFLLSASARGLKWVLVITGKGAPRRERMDDDVLPLGTEERGVLRRNVPAWLAEPELRAVVVSFTAAAISHGGDGALYVELRKPDRLR